MIGRTNTGGGGGKIKDTDAVLRVIAPAGSTVTITKGGVSKSDAGHENSDDNTLYDYYFVIHQSQFDSINPWTVTATLGGDSASNTIIIDSALEYGMSLSYLLPPEYQLVEYIESTGTQYINSGYKIVSGDYVEVHGQLTATQSSNEFCGVSSYASGPRFLIQGSNANKIEFNNGTNVLSSSAVSLNTDLIITVGTQFTVNGSVVNTSSINTTTRPLYLFGENNIGTAGSFGKVRMQYMLIKKNGVTQREFYPCYRKSDSVAGLYDIENGVFYTNAGSGSFVVGGNA